MLSNYLFVIEKLNLVGSTSFAFAYTLDQCSNYTVFKLSAFPYIYFDFDETFFYASLVGNFLKNARVCMKICLKIIFFYGLA